MANFYNLFRGGTPVVKCLFCNGQYAEFQPPFSMPSQPDTPPYDSHADAAFGQGYLNLTFPFVPRISYTAAGAHLWMVNALTKHKPGRKPTYPEVGDIILTNWVPLRSIVTDVHWEATKFDDSITGVYLKPVAYRAAFDFDADDFVYTEVADYASEVSDAGIGNIPLGTPAEGDSVYGYMHLKNPKCTFGHNIPTFTDGKPSGGFDDYFGAVLIGYEIAAGDEEQLKLMPYANFAVYSCAKCLAFECAAQL